MRELSHDEILSVLRGSTTVRDLALEWVDPLGEDEVKPAKKARVQEARQLLANHCETLDKLDSSDSPGPTFAELSAMSGLLLLTSYYSLFPKLRDILSGRPERQASHLAEAIQITLTEEGSAVERLRHGLSHGRLVPSEEDILIFEGDRTVRLTVEEAVRIFRFAFRLLDALHCIALDELRD